MRILHLAAGNRWTGAAAPAFAEVVALRAAGIDAHYAYVGGYKLQDKIGHLDFAHPLIAKAQHPLGLRRTLDALGRLVHQHRFDIIHAHLTYDHMIAALLARDHDVRLARTLHSRRVLRRDPFTQALLRRTELLFVINEAFRDAPALRGRTATFTPPPLDHAQFTPDGPDVRARYRLTAPVVTVIGKVARGRGFEEALQTFAALRRLVPEAKMMIIGHGEHRPALQSLATSLGITPYVTWAGYHEDDLAEHYRASDVLLFTARGSDEGHRAVLEAMACEVPVASYPIEGVAALTPYVAEAPSPEALAKTAAALIAQRPRVRERTFEFGYERAAQRLLDVYTPK